MKLIIYIACIILTIIIIKKLPNKNLDEKVLYTSKYLPVTIGLLIALGLAVIFTVIGPIVINSSSGIKLGDIFNCELAILIPVTVLMFSKLIIKLKIT